MVRASARTRRAAAGFDHTVASSATLFVTAHTLGLLDPGSLQIVFLVLGADSGQRQLGSRQGDVAGAGWQRRGGVPRLGWHAQLTPQVWDSNCKPWYENKFQVSFRNLATNSLAFDIPGFAVRFFGKLGKLGNPGGGRSRRPR